MMLDMLFVMMVTMTTSQITGTCASIPSYTDVRRSSRLTTLGPVHHVGNFSYPPSGRRVLSVVGDNKIGEMLPLAIFLARLFDSMRETWRAEVAAAFAPVTADRLLPQVSHSAPLLFSTR
jgi:hypothetical protein